MLKLGEHSAWVSVDGQPLETYAVETSLETNKVTCWIASEACKEFSLHYKDSSATRVHTVGVFVDIDGQSCASRLMYNTIEHKHTKNTVEVSDVDITDRIVKPFVFSAVQLTDEDDLTDTSSADLGQIQLKVYKVVVGDIVPYRSYQIQTGHMVHERSKKAVTHCLGLGKETVVAPKRSIETRKVGQPLAIFIFRYRDQNLLRANGIIPVPTNLKRNASPEIIDLTVHDIKDEGSRANALSRGEGNSRKIKETGERKKKKVKREQKPDLVVEGVIDLT